MRTSKRTVLVLTLTGLTVIGVYQDTNYCVKRVAGGPTTSRVFKSSSWIAPRRWFSEQLLSCLSTKTQSAEIANLRNFRL